MIESRAALLAVFAELSGKFAYVGDMVQTLEASREKCMHTIETASTANPLKKSRLLPENALYKTVATMLDAVRAETDDWRKEVASFEKCTNFRKCHSDSLLVYVYGKVKSGKSSLGNYLAYGLHNPTSAQVAKNPDVRPFFQDDSGQYNAQAEDVCNSRRLKVDFLEATSAIQGYTFPGLTWVDSPGIHSVTKENGALAQEYLKSADLVLYTTSAKSALRASDLQELKSILDTKKDFVLLTTKCSEIEEDEDENGNVLQRCVMLSLKDQKDVCNWCVNQLLEEGKKHCFEAADLYSKIFPISALYAELHPDAQGWEASGMAQLAFCLAKAAQQDGVRIKKQAPLQSLRAYNEKILASLEALETRMHAVHEAMERVRKDMKQEKESQLGRQSLALIAQIEQLAQYGTGQDEVFRQKVMQVGQECVDDANIAIIRVFTDSSASLMRQAFPASFYNVTFKSFENIYQEIRYHTSKHKRGGGLFGTLAGGLVGLLLGGPVGMLVGSVVGSVGGGAAGSCFDGEAAERVKNGDNSTDVRREACAELEKAIDMELKTTIAVLDETCVRPVQNWHETINNALLSLKTLLQSQQESIRKELDV